MRKKAPKKKKETTMDDLALMVQGGFKEVYEKMDEGFKEVDGKFKEVYEKMDGGFKEVNRRLDIIELKLFARHEREIEQLRERLLKVETKLARIWKPTTN